MSNKSSYEQILKSSSIMGGVAGINLIFGMVRTKFAAVLIGTAGIGLLSGFNALLGIIGVITRLGIQESSVREVAISVNKNDKQAIARKVYIVRRLSWLSGFIGMLIMILFSEVLSQLTFDSTNYTLDIAALGLVILFSNLSGGHMGYLQGIRRIGDLAKINLFVAMFGTISAIFFYHWLNLRGIVPSLITITFIQWIFAYYYASRVPIEDIKMSWKETFLEAKGLIRLGLAFMWRGLMGSAVVYITIMIISQNISLEAVGIYSAAFTLSSMFINFVLQAMSTDYFPRLSGLTDDKTAMNQLVNEQSEISLLLAAPGLVATLVLAPWIIQIFYTEAFISASELMQLLILGALGRVISWPMGYMILALGKSMIYITVELFLSLLNLAMVWIGIRYMGINGIGVGSIILYIVVTIQYYWIVKYLTGFSWNQRVKKFFSLLLLVLIFELLIIKFLSIYFASIIGVVLIFYVTFLSFKELSIRLGSDHKLSKAYNKIFKRSVVSK